MMKKYIVDILLVGSLIGLLVNAGAFSTLLDLGNDNPILLTLAFLPGTLIFVCGIMFATAFNLKMEISND